VTSDLAPELIVRDQWEKGAATVAVQGEIDIGTVGVFSACLADVIGRNPHQLVIDLTGVGFLDSSGLHAFVRVRKNLPEDCPIVLRAAQSHVRQVFEISGLSPVFTFE
jgi:anti-anti-sigma factor